MERRKVDIILASVLILLSIIILTNDGLVDGGVETDLGSLFLPRIVACFIILFAGTIGLQSFIKLSRNQPLDEHEVISTTGFLGVFLYVGIFVAYWFFVPYVGFLVATPFVMLAIAALLGGRNWFALIIMSVLVPLIIFYGSRQFLRVFLPTWSL